MESQLKKLIVEKTMTVSNLLSELGLESQYFAVLVDGKRVDLEHVIDASTEIIILPRIAGG
ncbi:MAG: MoaD/ThiS family protein [Candidatus Helarchaeota archaeon]